VIYITTLPKIWEKESGSYRFDKATQVDYLANNYHLVKCLGNPKGKKILEVGCGSGQSSAYLAEKGGDVHLVDISEKALKFAKDYFTFKKLPVKIYKQNAFSMNFPRESFDCVWNGGVIEHFSDKEKKIIIRNMWNLVKPGGKLLIMVPNAHDLLFRIAKKILEIRKKWAFGYEDDMTARRMETLARQAGIKEYSIYAFNPIVGIWFFPYGREITDFLNLNTLKLHKTKSPLGHVIVLVAKKPKK